MPQKLDLVKYSYIFKSSLQIDVILCDMFAKTSHVLYMENKNLSNGSTRLARAESDKVPLSNR